MAVEPEPSPPNGHKDSKPHHRWPNFPGLFVSTSLGVRPSAEEMKTSAEEREQKLQGEIADAVLTCLFGSVSDAPCSGDSLALTQIEGGISNLLYRVAFPEPQLVQGEEWVSVLVRVFGESDPLVGVCNRDTENLFYADAFQQGFGPGVVATFGNGRIERFFEDHRPLEPTEMLEPKFRDQISRICARLHELEMSSEVERAMAKWLMAGGEPEEDRGVAGRTGRTALIWSQNEDWLRKARKLYEAHRHQGGGEKWAFLDEALPKMERELAFWKGELGAGASSDGGALPADSGTSGVVEKQREICRQFWADVRPCHNDLLCGNMLQPLTTRGDGPPAGDHGGPAPVGTTSLAKEGLKVIDFEYALPNHVGFDVCNHFAAVPESMLIADGNFSPRKWFPDRNWIREWVRFYADERLSLRRDRRENAANTAVGTKKSYDAYSYQELVMWSG